MDNIHYSFLNINPGIQVFEYLPYAKKREVTNKTNWLNKKKLTNKNSGWIVTWWILYV